MTVVCPLPHSTDWIEIVALIVGPVAAVLITLAWERFRRTHDRRVQILQAIMATSATPANPAYTQAVNAAELEFANHTAVRTALLSFREVGLSDAESVRRLNTLIWAMMKAIGMRVDKAPTPREWFLATGLGKQDQLIREGLTALPRLATALERSARVNEQIHKLLVEARQGAPPPPPAA